MLAAPPADFTRVDPRAVALLAERWARRHGVLPLRLEGEGLLVATSDAGRSFGSWAFGTSSHCSGSASASAIPACACA